MKMQVELSVVLSDERSVTQKTVVWYREWEMLAVKVDGDGRVWTMQKNETVRKC
jgi:hypothetical protein